MSSALRSRIWLVSLAMISLSLSLHGEDRRVPTASGSSGSSPQLAPAGSSGHDLPLPIDPIVTELSEDINPLIVSANRQKEPVIEKVNNTFVELNLALEKNSQDNQQSKRPIASLELDLLKIRGQLSLAVTTRQSAMADIEIRIAETVRGAIHDYVSARLSQKHNAKESKAALELYSRALGKRIEQLKHSVDQELLQMGKQKIDEVVQRVDQVISAEGALYMMDWASEKTNAGRQMLSVALELPALKLAQECDAIPERAREDLENAKSSYATEERQRLLRDVQRRIEQELPVMLEQADKYLGIADRTGFPDTFSEARKLYSQAQAYYWSQIKEPLRAQQQAGTEGFNEGEIKWLDTSSWWGKPFAHSAGDIDWDRVHMVEKWDAAKGEYTHRPYDGPEADVLTWAYNIFTPEAFDFILRNNYPDLARHYLGSRDNTIHNGAVYTGAVVIAALSFGVLLRTRWARSLTSQIRKARRSGRVARSN